jgi:hypothetical protein
MSGTMVSADHHRELIDAKDARIRELENAFDALRHETMNESQDCSVLLNVAQYFVVRAIERGDYDQIRDALREAKDDTGLYAGEIADMVERLGLCSRDMVVQEYDVTITVPVTVTVRVEAYDDESAEDAGKEELECNGIDNYYMDIDWYNMEAYEVNEV